MDATVSDLIRFFEEKFAHADGNENPDEAVQQAERLLREGKVRTLCVHGDNPRAVAFVRSLRESLESKGIAIRKWV